MGKEGGEAASSSDYAIHEFQHLRNLIFTHGTDFSYRGNMNLVMFYWKSMAMGLVSLYNSFFNGFSGVVRYN
jgi:hypothetical protein